MAPNKDHGNLSPRAIEEWKATWESRRRETAARLLLTALERIVNAAELTDGGYKQACEAIFFAKGAGIHSLVPAMNPSLGTPLLCSCGEYDCEPGYLLCPECIRRNEDEAEEGL